jgi:quinol monooxygenase YgiN
MDDFLDVFTVRVKPEKRADFDMVCRKVAEANRKAKGDTWLAADVTYGEGNTVYFISTRKDYSAIDSGSTAFMNAIQEGYGPGGIKKMESDFNNTIMSSRSVIRRRRWDLSANGPKDADAYNKFMANARWLRTIRLVVRQGQQQDFEEGVKQVKAAFEQSNTNWPMLVSQTVAGEAGAVYYISSLQPSLAAFDSMPNLRKLLGDDAFLKWQKAGGETVMTSETMLLRFLPELSNPPEALATTSDFWRPKPVMAAKPKTAELAKAAK